MILKIIKDLIFLNRNRESLLVRLCTPAPLWPAIPERDQIRTNNIQTLFILLAIRTYHETYIIM